MTHLLTISKSEDWYEDDPDWNFDITCTDPKTCNGFETCPEPHVINGFSAGDGPYDSECLACEYGEKSSFKHSPVCDNDEFEFHGVMHTWQSFEFGWTVPFDGCVVIASRNWSDGVGESGWEIASAHGPGIYDVDVDWGDFGPILFHVARVDTAA
jgi:hypothetical protein